MHADFEQQQCLPPTNGFHVDVGSASGFHVETAPQPAPLQPAKSSPEDWLLPATSMALSAPSDCYEPSTFGTPQPQHSAQHLAQQMQQQQRPLTPPLAAPATQALSPMSSPDAAPQKHLQQPQAPHTEQPQGQGVADDPIADLLGCDWLLDPEAVAADARHYSSAPPVLPMQVGMLASGVCSTTFTMTAAAAVAITAARLQTVLTPVER